VAALRARPLSRPAGGEPDRAWQCALAGQGAMWALVTALLAREAGSAPSEAAWARLRFDEALAALRAGGAAERVLHDPVTAQKIVAGYADAIGDVDQTLPGERLGVDPLLRKDGGE
jgi:hypothetical protein